MFGVLGGLLVAYLVWLLVRGPQALQLGVTNGWVGTAFRLAAGVVCLIFGLRQRRGSYIPLVFGVALIFTAIGNTILTLDSLHGPPPPPPTPADFFGLGFIVLCFAGIGLMAHEDRQRLSPRELLDGWHRGARRRRGRCRFRACARRPHSGRVVGGCGISAC